MTFNTPELDVKKARRIFRRKKKQVIAITETADQQIDQLLFRRLTRLANIRKFLIGWLGLIAIIVFGLSVQIKNVGNYYLKDSAVEGGTYKEGIIGSFTNANPIYATSQVDVSVSKLVFSSLFTYDSKNEIVGDLVQDYTISNNDKTYTITLKPNVKWHDGSRLTSKDVLFTYQVIQNADAKSPLFSSWQGVKVTAVDELTVVFELPTAFSPFIYSMTNGIIPEHKLKDKPIASLRSENFNTIDAIGSGPFKMGTIDVLGNRPEEREESIALNRFDDYYRGPAKLDKIIIRSFRDEQSLAKAFLGKELNAASTLSNILTEGNSDNTIKVQNIPLTSIVMLFLNNSSETLSDKKIRQALSNATDVEAIKTGLGYELKPANSPLLIGQLGYDPERVQRSFNIDEANKLLDEAGWLKNDSGKRVKDGKVLAIRLVAQSLSEYSFVAQKVQEQWSNLGLSVDVTLQSEEDMQSGTIPQHDYDVLLYGIAIGKDPDVFAYWHSSQADVRSQSRLNLSEFKNTVADESLEAGRTRVDPTVRSIKYRPFLDAWRDEAPAISLYQPRYRFVVRGTFEGFKSSEFNSAIDRYATVRDWMIRTDKTVKTQEDLKD
jgi:peptide/nickel transport system substrate-binding protein